MVPYRFEKDKLKAFDKSMTKKAMTNHTFLKKLHVKSRRLLLKDMMGKKRQHEKQIQHTTSKTSSCQERVS
jgi:hypothetical protein